MDVRLETPQNVVTSRKRPSTIGAVLRQGAWAVLTLFIISLITFFGSSLKSPHDLAKVALGRLVTDKQEEVFIRAHNLNDPLVIRYERWLSDFATGDFGTSLVNGRPVRQDVTPRLERTLLLTLSTLLLSVPIGVALGVFSARRWGSKTDVAANVIAVTLSAFPEFVVALALLVLLGVRLGVLPVDSGIGIAFGSFGVKVKSYVLPTLTLVIACVPYIMRNSRIAVREALAAPYTRAAVLQGLPRRRVIWGRAMRNAISPTLNAIALTIIYLLGGVIVVENVFDFPGLGQALVAAVANGDTPTVQAVSMILGGLFIIVSVGTDVLATIVNPRLKAGGR